MRRWIVRALVFALPLTALAACGSDDPAGGGTDVTTAPAEATAPADFMEGLCAAIVSFQSDLETENASFQEGLSGGAPTPEETKTALGSFLGTAAARTEQLLDEVNELGTPDVDNGDDVRSALTTAFEQVVTLFNEAKTDIEGLSVDDPAALTEGFAAAGTNLQEAATGIGTSLEDLSSPDLEEAAAAAPSCKGVI
ncbi:MAG: hypothetical protein M3Q20_07190 [Actinomycetota bacterium]|nr:hypothetical protein [Actinomycetota bacterium]